MASNRITGKVIGFVVGAFLVLVALQIWWQRMEEKEKATDEEHAIKVARLRIEGRDNQVQVADEDSSTAKTRRILRSKELARQVALLGSADTTERRAAAFRLVFIANASVADVLVAGLKDPDGKVADRCAKALVRLWQRSDSAAVGELLERALRAHEADRDDEAMRALDRAAMLDAQVPDLYRLRAEIKLGRSQPVEALADCQKSIGMEQNHFLAYYLMARCYLAMGDREKALESVSEALRIYTHFEEAQHLKEKIVALRQVSGH